MPDATPRRVLAIALAASMIAGCSSVMPTATSTPVGTRDAATPGGGRNGSTTLTVDLAACESSVPCMAYGWVQRAGGAGSQEVQLFGWPADLTGALPSVLEEGTYTVHFRFVRWANAPSAEGSFLQTVAECEDEVRATGDSIPAYVDLQVSFRDMACSIEQRVSEAVS